MINNDIHAFVSGGMGNHPGGTAPSGLSSAVRSRSSVESGSTFWGNVCRAGYTSLGAAVGASLAGWGSVPGAVVGAVVGNTVCPP